MLDNAVFADLPVGALSENAFAIGVAATDASDRIIYDEATGTLWFDADGFDAGAAVEFAILTSLPSLTASDFLVI